MFTMRPTEFAILQSQKSGTIPAPPEAVWDLSSENPLVGDWLLSDDGVTATNGEVDGVSGKSLILADISRSSGKYYFEVEAFINPLSSSYESSTTAIGLGKSSTSYDGTSLPSNEYYVFRANGQIYSTGDVSHGTGGSTRWWPSSAAPAVIRVSVDFDTGVVGVTRAGGDTFMDISMDLSGDWFPMFFLTSSLVGGTLRTTSETIENLRPGFTPWAE